MIYLFTLLLAFCSIVYELLLAQTLATTMGNTVLRYSTTIGFYLFALGLGALSYQRKKPTELFPRLVRIELSLSTIGALSPTLVLAFDMLVHKVAGATGLPYRGWLLQSGIWIFNYGLIVAIGWLSGIELPLLMDLGNQQKKGLGNRVLVVDYIGTLAGSVLFPLLLLPVFGLFFVAHLVGFLNVFVAVIVLMFYVEKRTTRFQSYLAIGLSILLLAMVLNSQRISSFVIHTMYLGGGA